MNIFLIAGILGLIIISYAIWLKSERKQDLWFAIGGVLLLVYSVAIGNVIFSTLQIVFIASALLELRKKTKK